MVPQPVIGEVPLIPAKGFMTAPITWCFEKRSFWQVIETVKITLFTTITINRNEARIREKAGREKKKKEVWRKKEKGRTQLWFLISLVFPQCQDWLKNCNSLTVREDPFRQDFNRMKVDSFFSGILKVNKTCNSSHKLLQLGQKL